MIDYRDIPWVSQSVRRSDTIDPLGLNEMELLAHCHDLQREIVMLREMVGESIAQLATLTDQLRRATRVIEGQRQQLRCSVDRAA